MTARQLIDAGREHIAAGRSQEAVRCFALATADPAITHEARSMLAAAYLLPGSERPSLALRHVRAVAAAGTAGGEDLARCAMVALCAGDPELAEELAGLAAVDHPDALPILAAAKARRGDRQGVAQLLDHGSVAAGPFWPRLVMEALRRRWFAEALAACRMMRLAGMPAPGRLQVLLRAIAGSPWSRRMLVIGGLLAVLLPPPVAAGPLAVMLGAAVVAVPSDLIEGRLALGWSRAAWIVCATATTIAHWVA